MYLIQTATFLTHIAPRNIFAPLTERKTERVPSCGTRSRFVSLQVLARLTHFVPSLHKLWLKSIPTKFFSNKFRYYLDASPHRPRLVRLLVHICRLHLRLFCTYRTPVRKSLDYWPTLPIVIQYGESKSDDLPAPEDEDSIVAELKQSDRVNLVLSASPSRSLSWKSYPQSPSRQAVSGVGRSPPLVSIACS